MAERVSVFIFLLLALPAMLLAQFTSSSRNALEHPSFSQASIRGQILSPSGSVFIAFSVELCDHTGRVIGRATVMGSGEFVLDGVSSDFDVLRVLDADGSILLPPTRH